MLKTRWEGNSENTTGVAVFTFNCREIKIPMESIKSFFTLELFLREVTNTEREKVQKQIIHDITDFLAKIGR